MQETSTWTKLRRPFILIEISKSQWYEYDPYSSKEMNHGLNDFYYEVGKAEASLILSGFNP